MYRLHTYSKDEPLFLHSTYGRWSGVRPSPTVAKVRGPLVGVRLVVDDDVVDSLMMLSMMSLMMSLIMSLIMMMMMLMLLLCAWGMQSRFVDSSEGKSPPTSVQAAPRLQQRDWISWAGLVVGLFLLSGHTGGGYVVPCTVTTDYVVYGNYT